VYAVRCTIRKGTALSFHYHVFKILDFLDSEIQFAVRIWGLHLKQPVHPCLASNCPLPTAPHSTSTIGHGAMPSCRSLGMPLDGRCGLTCMCVCTPCFLPVSPLLNPVSSPEFFLVRVWAGLCRGLMLGEPSGLGEGLQNYSEGSRLGPANLRACRTHFYCFASGRCLLFCLKTLSTVLPQDVVYCFASGRPLYNTYIHVYNT